jgi:hypothetical protein
MGRFRKERKENIQLPIKKISSGMYILKVYTSIGELSKKL